MALTDALLPEFDQEMAATRKLLERVPQTRLAWKPHEKSGSMGWLAGHLANLPDWAVTTIKESSFDIAPNGVQHKLPPPPKTSKELLDAFDRNVKAARSAIPEQRTPIYFQPWSLLSHGQTLFTMPRSTCLRLWVMNHMIHHRAQLGVYRRLNNIPLPAVYGPSADEAN